MRTVAIVGGGISGLALGEAIERKSREAKSPVHAIVLEAEQTPGGKIKSSREEGFVVDTGPHGYLDKEPLMNALVERLGLSGSRIVAGEASGDRFVVRKGRLEKVPASPPAFLASGVLPFGAKLRVLLEPWAKGRPPGIDESVWAFAARRIGETAADQLVDAMVTGIYGGDSKALSLAAAFPRMRELEDQYGSLIRAQIALAKEKKGSAGGAPVGTMCTFKDGLGELTRALAAQLEVRTGFEARSILRTGGSSWRIEGTGPAIDADAVVLAVPAYAAKALLLPHAEKEAESIGGIRYPPIAVAIQGWRAEDVGDGARGFGFLAPHIEGRRILGTIFASSVFGVHAPAGMLMLRTVVGGTRRPDAALLPDGELSQLVRDELADLGVLPRNLPPAFERILRWPRAIPQYDIGHLERVAAADRLEARVPGLFLSGNAFRGVAMIACVVDADRVAARAIARLLSNEAKPAA